MSNTSFKVGAGWTKVGKNDKPMVSISFNVKELWKSFGLPEDDFPGVFPETTNLLMVENTSKKEDRHPDFLIIKFVN